MKMIRQISTPIIQSLIKILDDTIPEDEIHSFLQVNVLKALDNYRNSPDDWEPLSLTHLQLAHSLGSKLGIAYPEINIPQNDLEPDLTHEEISSWIKHLPRGWVVNKKGVYPGTGKFLSVVSNNDYGYAQFVSDNFERLLHHIEVKRKNALFLNPPGDIDQSWREKHAISVALSRHSRSKKDYRFLNAALKLNDWAFRSHKNLSPSPRLIHYLAALSEAEYTLSLIS